MKIKAILLTALLALSASAFGATPAPAAGTGGGHMMGHRYCEKNAQECKDQAAKFDQWCSANAEKCTDLKAFVERRREWCEGHKGECKEMRENMRKHMQEMCAKNPDMAQCKMKDEQQDDESMPPA